MNIIATIILTAFITSVITGIVSNFVFLRYQKRVEISFAEQLEEFRTKLQLSNFEKQTKFVRNHEKAVATLENLFKKYADVKLKLASIYYDVENFYKYFDAQVPFDDKFKIASEKIDDFRDYFSANRIFLSEDAVDLVSKITVFNVFILTLANIAITFHKDKLPKNSIDSVHIINNNIEHINDFFKINILKLDSNNPNMNIFTQQVIEEMNHLSDHLEKLFKLMSDIKS